MLIHSLYEYSLIDRYRKEFNKPQFPFIVCTVGSFITNKRFKHFDQINKVLLGIPKKRPFTACVDARDLKGNIGDNLHYSTNWKLAKGLPKKILK